MSAAVAAMFSLTPPSYTLFVTIITIVPEKTSRHYAVFGIIIYAALWPLVYDIFT